MTLGLFIGRLNPPHIGHISIIEKALRENDKVILMIGTKNYLDEKNPLSFYEIKEILLLKYKDEKKLEIVELDDKPTDLEWLKDILEKLGEFKKINFYGGDFENDSAFAVIKAYENDLQKYNFNYIEVSRKNSFIEYKGQKYEISATNLRQVLKDKNLELAEKFCDKKMFGLIKKYFGL